MTAPPFIPGKKSLRQRQPATSSAGVGSSRKLRQHREEPSSSQGNAEGCWTTQSFVCGHGRWGEQGHEELISALEVRLPTARAPFCLSLHHSHRGCWAPVRICRMSLQSAEGLDGCSHPPLALAQPAGPGGTVLSAAHTVAAVSELGDRWGRADTLAPRLLLTKSTSVTPAGLLPLPLSDTGLLLQLSIPFHSRLLRRAV